MELIKRIKGGGSNCYLITNKDKSILIDTGRKNKKKSILKACEGYNITLIDRKIVIKLKIAIYINLSR